MQWVGGCVPDSDCSRASASISKHFWRVASLSLMGAGRLVSAFGAAAAASVGEVGMGLMAREGDVVGVVLLRGVTVKGLSCLMGVPLPLIVVAPAPSSALIFLGVLGEEGAAVVVVVVVDEEMEGVGERGASFLTGAGEVEEELEGKLGFVGV